jgi:hypothetical protein
MATNRDVASSTAAGGGVARGGARGYGGAGLGQRGECAADGLRRSLGHQDGEAQGGPGGGEPDLHHKVEGGAGSESQAPDITSPDPEYSQRHS